MSTDVPVVLEALTESSVLSCGRRLGMRVPGSGRLRRGELSRFTSPIARW